MGRESGLNITYDDDFYTNPTMKMFYKNHAKVIMYYPFQGQELGLFVPLFSQ